jgi:hypothetical protein
MKTALPIVGAFAATATGSVPALAQTTTPPATTPAVSAPATSPAFDPAKLWDGRKLTPFKALDRPKTVGANEADFLDDDEYVLGVTVNGESRAYPTRYIWFHHVINDSVKTGDKETPFAVSYCSVCNTGIAFDTQTGKNGKPILLDFFGLYNGIVALCDRETESVFPQASEAFANGPLVGQKLPVLPLLDTTWGQWKKLHPQTRVMQPEQAWAKFYRPKGKGNAEPRDYQAFPAPFFAPTVSRADKRLAPFDKVLAVTIVGPNDTFTRRAYPVKDMQASAGIISETVGTIPVAVLFDAQTVSAFAVSPVVDGKTLTLEAKVENGVRAFYDKETGTRWNLVGVGEAGTHAGKRLPVLNSHLSQWYGWSATFPDTTIYNRTDAPMPATWAEVAPKPATKP